MKDYLKFKEQVFYFNNEDGSIIFVKDNDETECYKISGIEAEIFSLLKEGRDLTQTEESLNQKYTFKGEQLNTFIKNFCLKLESLDVVSLAK